MLSKVLLTLVLIKDEATWTLVIHVASLTYNMGLYHGKHTGWDTKQQRQLFFFFKKDGKRISYLSVILHHSKKNATGLRLSH